MAGWCIAGLLQRGYQVRTTIRSAPREQAVRAAVAAEADPDGRLSFAVADLTADQGWDEAVAGCAAVLHVAAPLGESGEAADLITPARDGALRVLRAAYRAGVPRVVMTSAANAASPSSYAENGVTDETLWTDPGDPALIPYRRAKTLAERAAWDFAADHAGPANAAGSPTTLTTILPGAVLGPVLDPAHPGTASIVARMLAGRMRAAPRISLEVADVRDIADIHIRAMTSPAAAGERFLATGELMSMREIATVLRDGLGERAARAPTREVPDIVVRFAARFADPSLRSVLPGLGRRNRHSTDKARRLLGWQPRPAAETILTAPAASSATAWSRPPSASPPVSPAGYLSRLAQRERRPRARPAREPARAPVRAARAATADWRRTSWAAWRLRQASDGRPPVSAAARSSPPSIDRFFRKQIFCWLRVCGSSASQNRCPASVVGIRLPAMASAASRGTQPMASRVPPASWTAPLILTACSAESGTAATFSASGWTTGSATGATRSG